MRVVEESAGFVEMLWLEALEVEAVKEVDGPTVQIRTIAETLFDFTLLSPDIHFDIVMRYASYCSTASRRSRARRSTVSLT